MCQHQDKKMNNIISELFLLLFMAFLSWFEPFSSYLYEKLFLSLLFIITNELIKAGDLAL